MLIFKPEWLQTSDRKPPVRYSLFEVTIGRKSPREGPRCASDMFPWHLHNFPWVTRRGKLGSLQISTSSDFSGEFHIFFCPDLHLSLFRVSEIPQATGNLSSQSRGEQTKTGLCWRGDSIAARVKDPVCLPRLSEARPSRKRERSSEQREMRQRESRFSALSTWWWWHADLINYHFIWMWAQLFGSRVHEIFIGAVDTGAASC